MRWIRPYNVTLSDWTKRLTAKTFCVSQEANTDCTILVATDAYGMEINNLDVKLVIQWDIPLTFDFMIQRMERARRKSAQSTFVFLSPKWTQIDANSDKIQKQTASKNTPFICAKAANLQRSSRDAKLSPLSQRLDANNDMSDTESVDSADGSEADFDLDADASVISSFLATEADKN